MFEHARKSLGIEQNANFAKQVLFLSFPTAMVFIVLSAFHLVDPLLAVISLAAVVLFNVVILFPLMFELQQIRRYVSSMAGGADVDEKAMKLSEKDAQALVDAINAMHRFWAQKLFPIQVVQ